MRGIVALVVALGLALTGCEEMPKGGGAPVAPPEQTQEPPEPQEPDDPPKPSKPPEPDPDDEPDGPPGTGAPAPTGSATDQPSDDEPTGGSGGGPAAPAAGGGPSAPTTGGATPTTPTTGVCSALWSLPAEPIAVGEPCGCDYDAQGNEVRLLFWTSVAEDRTAGHCGP